jgi:hypothetical protein
MVSLDSVVIALSQVKVGRKIFGFFSLFPCSERGTLRVLYGKLNAHSILTFRTGFDIKRLGPYNTHINGWRTQLERWVACGKPRYLRFHSSLTWNGLPF